jgi:hypothetical protein
LVGQTRGRSRYDRTDFSFFMQFLHSRNNGSDAGCIVFPAFVHSGNLRCCFLRFISLPLTGPIAAFGERLSFNFEQDFHRSRSTSQTDHRKAIDVAGKC